MLYFTKFLCALNFLRIRKRLIIQKPDCSHMRMMGSKKLLYAALALLTAGIVMLIAAALRGEISIALILIFPVIFGSGLFAFLGMLSIVGGIFILFINFAIGIPIGQPEQPEKDVIYPTYDTSNRKEQVKGGGVVLIGPIPIVFGSDTKVTNTMLILAIVLTLISVFLFLGFILFGLLF